MTVNLSCGHDLRFLYDECNAGHLCGCPAIFSVQGCVWKLIKQSCEQQETGQEDSYDLGSFIYVLSLSEMRSEV